MKVLFNVLIIGLTAILGAGCASDPFYLPQGSTYGTASTVSVPSKVEGVDILSSSGRLATRVPQEESMQVAWDLHLYPSYGWQRPPERRHCEVLIKPVGSLNYAFYECERVEKVGRDFFVYFWFDGDLTAVNLQSKPGGFVRNGFCESGVWTPGRQMVARVVWQTHETVRPSGGLARAIGCQPG